MKDPKPAEPSRPAEAAGMIDWSRVYKFFDDDKRVSRKELEWVRLKLRKYAAAVPAPPADAPTQRYCPICRDDDFYCSCPDIPVQADTPANWLIAFEDQEKEPLSFTG